MANDADAIIGNNDLSAPPPTYSESTAQIPKGQSQPSTNAGGSGLPGAPQLEDSSVAAHYPSYVPPGGPLGSPRKGPSRYGPTPMNDGGYSITPARVNGGAIPVYIGNGAVAVPGPQGLLPVPFYDPNSPHSIAMANARARWRFFEAFLWAFLIWAAMGLVFGTTVEDIHRGRRHGHG